MTPDIPTPPRKPATGLLPKLVAGGLVLTVGLELPDLIAPLPAPVIRVWHQDALPADHTHQDSRAFVEPVRALMVNTSTGVLLAAPPPIG